MSRDELIANGRACLLEGEAEAGLRWFREAALVHADDAHAWFEYAGAFDYLGREAEAEQPYLRAKTLGLSPEEQPRWHVQYGSTLRNLGRHDEALAVLSEGCERFPRHLALRLFRSLALHSAGRHGEALAACLETTLQAVDPQQLDGYDAALGEYAGALRVDAAQPPAP